MSICGISVNGQVVLVCVLCSVCVYLCVLTGSGVKGVYVHAVCVCAACVCAACVCVCVCVCVLCMVVCMSMCGASVHICDVYCIMGNFCHSHDCCCVEIS